MLTVDDLLHLTDPATISRGRAYARTNRVTVTDARGESVHAQVDGTHLYRVEMTGSTWACSCPVGVTGNLCKHCVAVVIAMDEGIPLPGPGASPSAARGTAPATPPQSTPPQSTPPPDSPMGWLRALSHNDLIALIEDACVRVGGLDVWVAQEYLAATGDVDELASEVEETLRPRKSFYDYRHANAYADEAEPLISVIADLAEQHPSPELLTIVERALTLTVRTITRSDDSSGYQGSQVHTLLDAHVVVAAGLAGTLDRKAQRRLATWLHKFAFSDTQDFFNPEVDAYADTLEEAGLGTYSTLVERTAESGKHSFAVEHARGRLAILTGDADQIIAIFGGDLTSEHQIIKVVEALDEAGLAGDAVCYAQRGLDMPAGHRRVMLVDRMVLAARNDGDIDAAIQLRHDHFMLVPASATFRSLRATAQEAGEWDRRRDDAEATLSTRSPNDYLQVLLAEQRDDVAWDFALAHPESADRSWEELCTRRALTAPADTLPIYTSLVTSTLTVTDRHAYSAAARLLVKMRVAAIAAGRDEDFEEFMIATAAANTRRPTCIAAFKEAGLI